MGIKDITIGSSGNVTAMIKSVQKAQTVTANVYQKITILDEDGTEAVLNSFNEMIEWELPAVAKMAIEVDNYKGTVVYRVVTIEKDNTTPLSSFYPKSHIDPAAEWKDLMKIIKELRPGLSRIICKVIRSNKEEFYSFPKNPSGAFSRQCGILESTIKLVKLADAASGIMEGLDRDLLIAGAILYYMGYTGMIDAQYNTTKESVLMSAGVIGCNKVQMAVYEIQNDPSAANDLDMEDVVLLYHILISRMGEIGTAIPEAVVLRHMDHILQKTDGMNEKLKDMNAGDTIVGTRDYRMYKKVDIKESGGVANESA